MAQKKRIKEDISYTDAIAEVEKIIAELSNGKVEIDTLPTHVKRGSELIELCRNRLRETEEALNKVFKE